MLLMFENGQYIILKCMYNNNLVYILIGIRGGLVQVSKRYAKANNVKTPGYDVTKEKSWIIYQDCKYIFIFIFYFLNIFNFFKFL